MTGDDAPPPVAWCHPGRQGGIKRHLALWWALGDPPAATRPDWPSGRFRVRVGGSTPALPVPHRPYTVSTYLVLAAAL
ncbi:hypothetical protein E2C01_046513 [Portunus trituberculatus]|uniref:Uncharacterized protein n=1 Tax=Portunus trituberculatus TaxID=210409 RepID=A0A5B7G676_PORTR|nr:hypothetical protein [Portunus trituberculatus]